MTRGTGTCRHCGQDIRFTSSMGWVHLATRANVCAGIKRVAEPKRVVIPGASRPDHDQGAH